MNFDDMSKRPDRRKFFAAAQDGEAESPIRVDRQARVIYGVSMCREGEAKGHGVHLDSTFISDVVKFANGYGQGMKSRFGHPAMCNDAIGTYCGRLKDARMDGTAARADLHLDDISTGPNGDIGAYLMDMAEKAPDMFGLSIVFTPGYCYQFTDDGSKRIVNPWAYDDAPDAPEKDKPIYESIEALHACDAVDTPAANDHLFSDLTIAGKVTEFLDTHPEVFTLADQNPHLVAEFLDRYKSYQTRMKKPQSFTQKVANQIKKFGHKLGLISFTDATTVDGEKIRIGNTEGEAPKVGDSVDVINEEGVITGPAPDGNHIITGGDYDGWVISTEAGKITAIDTGEEAPADPPAEDASPAAQLAALRQKIKALSSAVAALERENEALKNTPPGGHTPAGGQMDPSEKSWEKQSWNQSN